MPSNIVLTYLETLHQVLCSLPLPVRMQRCGRGIKMPARLKTEVLFTRLLLPFILAQSLRPSSGRVILVLNPLFSLLMSYDSFVLKCQKNILFLIFSKNTEFSSSQSLSNSIMNEKKNH